MTISQLKGMINFHRRAELAYRSIGDNSNADAAHAKMIELQKELAKAKGQTK